MNTDTKKLPISLKKGLTITKIDQKVKEALRQHPLGNDPDLIFVELRKEYENTGKLDDSPDSNTYRALTVFEFDKGILLSASIPKRYHTFAIDFFRNLQKEYKCETPSEKATAELVALNFIRTLEIQNRMQSLFSTGELAIYEVQCIAILGKELDRANRHYLNALQTLRMLKQPALNVNIKTQTAVVGQNQIIQTNNK